MRACNYDGLVFKTKQNKKHLKKRAWKRNCRVSLSGCLSSVSSRVVPGCIAFVFPPPLLYLYPSKERFYYGWSETGGKDSLSFFASILPPKPSTAEHLLSGNTHSCLWHYTFPMSSPLGAELNQEQKTDIKNSVWKTSITYISVIVLDSLSPEQPWVYYRVSKTPKRPSWMQTKDAPCPAQLVKASECFGPSEICRAQVWKQGAFYCSCWGKGRAPHAETRTDADVAPDSG